MTATSGEPKESRPLAALTELARDSVEPPSATELDRGLDAVCARIADARPRRLLRWSLVGVTAVCAVASVHFGLRWAERSPIPEPAALAYRIEGGDVLEGGYLRESGKGGVRLFFNEGTKLLLLPGARGRVRAVDNKGARFSVEHGTASFEVTPSSGRQWLVEVGPFVVTVKGTSFTVSWDVASERFELRLRHGQVTVKSPISGGDIALRAGQRLVVNLPKAETLITEDKPDVPALGLRDVPASPSLSPSVARPSPVIDKPASRTATTTPARSALDNRVAERHWQAELANGHWDKILEEVERAGVKATLETASSDDLFALADAARYRRRTELARAALLAERRRFPGSGRALDAIFLLGRVEESSERGMAEAIKRYDDYLQRAPVGPYAAEALGRKMTLTNELSGPTSARPIAEEYLRRFPRGSYAGSARALRRVP